MKLTTGVDDFKEVIEKDYTYVDKTLFIEELVENTAKVQLITRPRRFGKTLNMSMLAYFFDHSIDNAHLFRGLAIEQRPSFSMCGSRPVIFLSFKELKADDFETFLIRFSLLVSRHYQEHGYLVEQLGEADVENYERILKQRGEKGHLMAAIAQLVQWLESYHGKKVLLLIDEYDSPMHEALHAGYYEPVISFMRGALGEALKGNRSLYKGVLTGILRISKESIFSDLNHIEVHTVLDPGFANRFGFSEAETLDLLRQAGGSDKMPDVQAWYNGYKIAGHIIYNPWSVINYLKQNFALQAYWVNTSSNNLIYQLLTQAEAGTQETLTELIHGNLIETPIYSQTTLRDLDDAALWSLLLFSGYLTVDHETRKGSRIFYHLRIPNEEVRLLYQDIFMRWLNLHVGSKSMSRMLKALTDGDVEVFAIHFQEMVATMFSYFDTSPHTSERVYHAFVLGLLANLDYRYHIRSNRESGYGRYDLMMIPKDPNGRGIIMEFKLSQAITSLEQDAGSALEQIISKAYPTEMKAQGITTSTLIGIAFCGKHIKVIGRNA